jgi:hypothetical protein
VVVAVAGDDSGVAVVVSAAEGLEQESCNGSGVPRQGIPAVLSTGIARPNRSSWTCCWSCTGTSCCLAGPNKKKSAGLTGRLGNLLGTWKVRWLEVVSIPSLI